ncbi:alpha/beta-hydrolase [Aspergillus ellipticus CBS 707.79]|uniref:Alpha/beta-hydrolase n=1 Tax=Aspergillus ellipticus CBS 707.79 TaxID=1448320 RepID=A0A319EFH8_9EURO|nr:alpha/beta-hydrolase [Aspergillus ellipticus CBS 707.79]
MALGWCSGWAWRQTPVAQRPPTGLTTITTPNNVTLRYKESGTEGVCETTPGVRSYAGYVDLAPDSHTFFWFFESRRDPTNDPVTLWLNGGPGSDSLIGLFEELGPCHINSSYDSFINPYSWNEVSNLLFLSQPLGVGFSYSETEAGSLNPFTGVVENASFAGFFKYFQEQNEKIAKGTVAGVHLDFNSLGIINGIIDEAIQASYYPEFAVNETVYNYMKFANKMPNGCQDQIDSCKETNRSSLADYAICTEAANMCRDNVEGPYYQFGGRGVYDIRHLYEDPEPPSYYTQSSSEVFYAFQQTGDFVWLNFIEDLEEILKLPVRLSLIYGDADYICNWFGGQAISLAVDYAHAAYGQTRESGNLSFTRVYEAGHEVPYYQPTAVLQLFNRTLFGWDIAAGITQISLRYNTNGISQATHSESLVPPPTHSI